MGLYYKDTGKTWGDNDLKKPYGFEEKIYFKKGRIPNGIPTLYRLEISTNNIIMHNNFPFEFIIKKGKNVTKIKNKELDTLLKNSRKMANLFDNINFLKN